LGELVGEVEASSLPDCYVRGLQPHSLCRRQEQR
jgi:hypothetical protein